MSSFGMTYEIALPNEVVWDNFFNKVNSWWSKEFNTNPRTRLFIIDTFIGGKMYEHFGEGEGLIWGDVIGVDRPNSLQVRGMLSGEFGGPAMSFEQFRFNDTFGRTDLNYRAEFMGNISEKTLSSLESGWKTIFEAYFIPFCKR